MDTKNAMVPSCLEPFIGEPSLLGKEEAFTLASFLMTVLRQTGPKAYGERYEPSQIVELSLALEPLLSEISKIQLFVCKIKRDISPDVWHLYDDGEPDSGCQCAFPAHTAGNFFSAIARKNMHLKDNLTDLACRNSTCDSRGPADSPCLKCDKKYGIFGMLTCYGDPFRKK